MEEVDWAQKLQACTVGYDGAEVYTAERLDLERICAALPPARVGGLVNAADVSTGFVRDAFLDPSLVLRSDALEDDRPRDPVMWASDVDWQELAVVLVKTNICELIELNEKAEVNGRKVLGDLMGVAKGGNDRNTGPQRLIMNIKLLNWAQHVTSCDMPQLPSSGQRRCLVLEHGETLVGSGEDLKCCLYVFEIPKPWRRWMSFAAPVARSCFFPGSTGMDYICSKVPMGWISATWVISTCASSLADDTVAPPALPRSRGGSPPRPATAT